MGLISLCLPGLVVSVYGNVVNSDADEFRLTAEVVLPNSADDDVDDDCDNDDDNEDGGVVKSALLSANNDENDVDGVAVNDDDDNNDGDDAVDDDVDVVDNVVAVAGVIAVANVELRKLASRVTVLRVASSTTTSTTPSSSTNPFPLLAASSATVTPTMLYSVHLYSIFTNKQSKLRKLCSGVSNLYFTTTTGSSNLYTTDDVVVAVLLRHINNTSFTALLILLVTGSHVTTAACSAHEHDITSLVLIYSITSVCRTQVWLYNTA